MVGKKSRTKGLKSAKSKNYLTKKMCFFVFLCIDCFWEAYFGAENGGGGFKKDKK